jgi:hypothetical protein
MWVEIVLLRTESSKGSSSSSDSIKAEKYFFPGEQLFTSEGVFRSVEKAGQVADYSFNVNSWVMSYVY